ncbi:uracil-DNA glycosylase [Pseudooceanicola algae]|nr:uracil-DNA glycosylase [Pseudooceanicola algae]
MESALDWDLARSLLEWQVEMGVDEAIGDAPVNRFEVTPEPSRKVAAHKPGDPPRERVEVDAVDVARIAAEGARSLDALREALATYEHCELRNGARNLVFSDGQPGARVMILGEAPGREEDREGTPFVGPEGALLNKMLAAIGLSRDAEDLRDAVYIANVLPWRPPQNRDPRPEEIAMLQPFLQKHVALARPEVLVLMGNTPCQAVLGKRGILKLRGQWGEAFGLPVLPMAHPASLLGQPESKREAWADLLSLRAKLGSRSAGAPASGTGKAG